MHKFSLTAPYLTNANAGFENTKNNTKEEKRISKPFQRAAELEAIFKFSMHGSALHHDMRL